MATLEVGKTYRCTHLRGIYKCVHTTTYHAVLQKDGRRLVIVTKFTEEWEEYTKPKSIFLV